MRRALIALFVSFGFLAAGTTSCGKSEPQQGSGGIDAGTQGGTGGGTGGAAGSGGIVEAASCDGYDDELASAVTITYQNARQSAVYLINFDSCEPVARFELANAAGSVKTSIGGDCIQTCADSQISPTAGLCDAACTIPGIVVISPGGSYHEDWSGRIVSEASMPIACYAVPSQASATCPRRVLAPSGDYTFDAKAGTSCDGCSCTPSGEGSCIFHANTPSSDAGPVSGETLTATATITLPSANEIKLVFQ